MWNDLKFGIPLMQVFSLLLFLMGYFQVKTTFDDIYEVSSSNDQPMKVILILVDALRIDLFANQNFTFYQNMKKEREEYQILYYGISTAPTATQLNLQTITTGNFPAFIDFGSNMAANELKEDNIIYSMKRNQKKIALLGDDTWFHMFPNSFDYKFVSESFDVRDLDTDDNIVMKHIEGLIDDKYDFIVGHLLGIDHSGHSYNDSNQALWNKQQQYSELFYKIYNKMDNNTMLLIVGDHGMSSDGNHGGDSPKEISSTVYAINKGYKFHKKIFHQVINNRQYINEYLLDRNQYQRQIYSINVAPTIAYLMGISIPFSNVGAVLTEMINSTEQQQNSCKENYIQILQYLKKQEQNEISFDLNIKEFQLVQNTNQFQCQNIQEQILNIQYQLKENSKTYDYFYLISGLIMMILLFALHLLKLSEIQFNKQFCNKKTYFFYRLEVQIIMLPIFGFLLTFMNYKVSIKFISTYLILLLLKICVQPLFNLNNLKTIVVKILYPLPHYRQYFFIIVNVVVQKGIQELSANRQIVYTANIFGILLNVVIMILISQIKLIKQSKDIVLALLLLLLAEQYNTNHSSMKPQSPLIFNFLSNLINLVWIKYLFPIIFLQRLFRKIQMNISFSILFGIAQFIHLFYNCSQFNEFLSDFMASYSRILTVYIPFFTYISSIIFIFLYQDFNYFFIIIITVSGKSGMIAYFCLFYSIVYFKKFFDNIDNNWMVPILGAIIQLILNFIWFDLGHRMSFSNVKFQDALIGTESYSVLFNTTLLIISIFGVFATQKIIEKIIDIYSNDNTPLVSRLDAQLHERSLDFMIAFQFSQVIFASIHNILNLYHQNIVELFAQKIIYEAIILTVIVIVKVVSNLLQCIQIKIKEHRTHKNYYIIDNDIKEKNKE